MSAERTQLVPLVGALAGTRVLLVGDVMLDHFHTGRVERISPEAPIPVIRVEDEESMLGGAGNVLRNLVGLGAAPRFVTVIGRDGPGRVVARMIKEHWVTEKPIVDKTRRTSTKTRFIAGAQQVLRADRESTEPLSAAIERKVITAAGAAMRSARVIVLSDYGKGVLSGRAAAEIIRRARKARKPVIVDPKGDDFGRYRRCDLITPNRRELADATGQPCDSRKDAIKAARGLIKKHRFGAVLVTLSADGMVVVPAKGRARHLPAEAREVFDVSGAGDTVAATVAAALGAGLTLEDAARLANVAAGVVVGKVGTAAATAADVVHALHHQDLTTAEAKVLTAEQARDRIAVWHRAGHAIGFTNGCFDLLHPGHVSLLKQARRACDRLVVGLNSDASVTRLKGDGRPVQSEAARAAVLASLETVDAVVIFAEATPLKLIKAFKPDVLVKGADYAMEDVVGADVVRKQGGKVVLAKLEPGHSTSATIARLAKGRR